MFKSHLPLLVIFPLLTQLVFTFCLGILNGFNIETLTSVFSFFTLPAFLFAVVCNFTKYHQRNLIQVMLMPAIVSFITAVVFMSIIFIGPKDFIGSVSLLEQSLMNIMIGLMIAGANAIYSMLILRPFLPKSE
ncbi:hypothetical protein [Glaesserella sp.]|uniref:hypothetical protein n=1 Tax=Glaesserella sp. TaxID=2094731 RepID=UPI00359F8F6C